jgi:hypothetical protein
MYAMAVTAEHQFSRRLRPSCRQARHLTANEPCFVAATPSRSCPLPPHLSILRCLHHHMTIMNSLYRFYNTLHQQFINAGYQWKTYRTGFETSVIRFMHERVVKVVRRSSALQCQVMEVLEHSKREHSPGKSEAGREPRGLKEPVGE